VKTTQLKIQLSSTLSEETVTSQQSGNKIVEIRGNCPQLQKEVEQLNTLINQENSIRQQLKAKVREIRQNLKNEKSQLQPPPATPQPEKVTIESSGNASGNDDNNDDVSSDDVSETVAFLDDDHIDQLKLKLRNLRDSMTSTDTEFLTRNFEAIFNAEDASTHSINQLEQNPQFWQLEQRILDLKRKLSEKQQNEETLRQRNITLRAQIKLLNDQIGQVEQLCKTLQQQNEELQQKNLSLITEHSIETLKHQQEVDKLNEIIKGHRTSHFELSKMNDELHEQFLRAKEEFSTFKLKLQLILNKKDSDHHKIAAIASLLEESFLTGPQLRKKPLVNFVLASNVSTSPQQQQPITPEKSIAQTTDDSLSITAQHHQVIVTKSKQKLRKETPGKNDALTRSK